MFISKEQTLALTGYDVDSVLLTKAQSIIEAYVGKVEGEVDDAGDLSLLGKAVAYQAAYMKVNTNIVFEQAAVAQIGQFGQLVSFRQNDSAAPFVAPLAVMSCKNLSWRRARAITTGRVFGSTPGVSGWFTE
jgi:hypothetical protein